MYLTHGTGLAGGGDLPIGLIVSIVVIATAVMVVVVVMSVWWITKKRLVSMAHCHNLNISLWR